MVLVQKWPFFQKIFFGNIGQKNLFYDILQWKNSFLRFKNKKFIKSKNWHLSKGVNPWFRSKNGHFFQLFFLGNIGKENVFYNILQRKSSFQGYKNKKLKKSKNSHFYQGLTYGFCPKMTIIPTCFIRQYRQGKSLSRYSITKKAYLGYKNKKFKKSRNWHFSKGVNVSFWSKNRHFSKLLFFRQYRPWKCLLRYFTTKKLLSRL